MENPVVSFIVPVYNVKSYLATCVASLLAQKGGDIECICVDDGSSDGSSELLDLLAANDSRIVVVHQKNAGVGVARNVGIERARGRYLSFVDSDDILEPDFLTCALKAFDRYSDLDVWVGQVLWATADNVVMAKQGVKTSLMDTTDPLNDFLHAKGRVYCYTVFPKVFRSSLVKQSFYRFPVGTRSGEDMAFMSKVYSGARRVVVEAPFVYRYRVLQSGLLHADPVKLIPDRLMSIRDVLAFAKETGRLPKMQRQIGFVALGSLRGMIEWKSWNVARNYAHAYFRRPEFREIILRLIIKYAPLKYRVVGWGLWCLPNRTIEWLILLAWWAFHLKKR